MTKKKPTSLMDCLNAKYPSSSEYIYCSKGHKLGDGRIHKRSLDKPLICRACQGCKDFVSMNDEEVK